MPLLANSIVRAYPSFPIRWQSTEASYRNRRLDARMRFVTHQLEIFELEVMNVFYRWIQLHPRQRPRLARELQPGLVKMIGVQVQVAERVNERAGL
jgi:hypothetical protein